MAPAETTIDETQVAPTLDEVAARLRASERDGAYVVSAETLGAPEVGDLLDAVGLSEAALADPKVLTTDKRLVVTGTAGLLGLPAMAARLAFTIERGALSVALTATYPDATGFRLPGLPWAAVGDLSLRAAVTGPSLPSPVVALTFAGTIRLDGHADPVEITLAPRYGRPEWLLRATDIPLPDLQTLAQLIPGQDPAALSPPNFEQVDGLRIVDLSCAFDPVVPAVRSVHVAVGAPGVTWGCADGVPGLRDVRLDVTAEFDDDPDETRDDATPAARSVAVSAGATAVFGEIELPVRLAREPDASWRLSVLGAHGFPSLGELVAAGASPATAAMLPAALHDLRMAAASLEVVLAPDDPTLRSVFVGVRMAEHWPLIDGHLALEQVALELTVDRVASETRGFVTGVLMIEGNPLPVAVTKPGAAEPWTLTLGAAAPTLAGVGSLAGIAGDDVAAHLPAGFADGAVRLDELTIAFDPVDHAVSRASVALHSDGPWSLPELDGFDVRGLGLHLDIAHPGDATRRTITGRIAGTVDVAGVSMAIRASKPSADAPWALEGELQPGTTMELATLADRAVPGRLALPSELPGLVVSSAAIALTPATGAFVLQAGSAGPWRIPLGLTELQVSQLALDLHRSGSGQPVAGSLRGTFTLAGLALTASYALPGELVLAGHAASVSLGSLIGEFAGEDLARSLAMPDGFRALELRDLDFLIAPSSGRFSASAAMPGFDDVAFLVQHGAAGWGIALALAPAADAKLSDLDPALAFLDHLSLGNTLLVVSTTDDAGPIGAVPAVRERLGRADLKIGHGLTLLADFSLADTGADEVLGMQDLRVRASIDSSGDTLLEARVGGPFPLGEAVVLQEVDLRVHAGSAGFDLGLYGEIHVVLDPTSRLVFVGGLMVTPEEARCALTMLGTWHEPFGVRGLSVGDVALELGWSYSGAPSIGIAGSMTLGEFRGDVALEFDPGAPGHSMVVVRFNQLKLGVVLAELCHEAFHDAIPPEIVRTVADISFEDVEIYVVPQDTRIGELEYKQGLRLKAKMSLWGIEADADVEIDHQRGLFVDGHIDPIEFGEVFALRGAGTHDKPTVHLEVSDGTVPTVDIAGEVTLLGISRSVAVLVSDAGFSFETTADLFGLFSCSLKVAGGHLGDTNGFLVEATMTNDLFEYLREHATAALHRAAADADQALASVQSDLREAEAELAEIDRKIAARRRQVEAERDANRRALSSARARVVSDRQRELQDVNARISRMRELIAADRWRDTQALVDAQRRVQSAQSDVDALLAQMRTVRTQIQGERDLADRRMRGAQSDVDAAQRNVDSILSKIRENEAWWNRLPQTDWPWNASKARDGAWYGPMIAGLYVGYGTATGALQAYRKVLEGIQAGARSSPIELDPRMSGLTIAHTTASGALKVAVEVLEGAKTIQTAPPIDADPRMVALYGERGIVQAALEAAAASLDAIQGAADFVPAGLDPEIVALSAGRDIALGVLHGAEHTVEVTRISVGGALDLSASIAHYALGGLVDVRRASFSGGLDAVHGGRVRLSAELEFLGRPHDVEFEFDFHDLEASVANLVRELVPA